MYCIDLCLLQVTTVGLDTQIERTIRIPEELDKEQSEEEMEQQPGTITEEEEVTSGEEEQVPDLKERPNFKPRRSMDSVSQEGEKGEKPVKKKFSILSLVELDPVTTGPTSPTLSSDTSFLNLDALLSTELLQRKLSVMSVSKMLSSGKNGGSEPIEEM